MANLQGGRVILGISSFRGEYMLPKILKKFNEKYPGKRLPFGFRPGEVISGAALRQFGFVVPEAVNGFQAWQIYMKECPYPCE